MFTMTISPGLGLVPLLIAAGLIGTGAWLKLRQLEDYELWKESVPEPSKPPAPPAPETRQELTDPALWATIMPSRTLTDWEKWKSAAIPPQPPASPADTDLLLAAGAVGAIALFVLLRS